MSITKELTMLISTCQAYSDLWDANILLLNRNWADRGIKTILLTDAPCERKYENISMFSAGEKEWSERLGAVLPEIETEFILLTLDDYFITQPISTKRIERLIKIMIQENIDYIRLSLRPWENQKFKRYKDLFKIDLNKNYAVNLSVGIWRKSFLEKLIQEPLNAWKFEVSLTKIARTEGATCAMSKGSEFPVLDVIRKGKLLRKAYQYFKKDPIYSSSREIMKWKDEIFLEIRTVISFIFPRRILLFLKQRGRNHGMVFYSE